QPFPDPAARGRVTLLMAPASSAILLAGILDLFLWTGYRGIDFGFHWDEGFTHIDPVKQMVETSTLLPGLYLYPSFDYWINLAVLTPDAMRAVREVRDDLARSKKSVRPAEFVARVKSRILTALDQPGYLLRARTTYLLITSLSLIWVYLTVIR